MVQASAMPHDTPYNEVK